MKKTLLTMQTPGKINLGLNLLRERSDGYHDIETLFLPVGLYDEITVNPDCAGIKITCDHPDVPLDENNLCWKAAELLLHQTQSSRSVEIIINKKIPVAGGMGGGSSNAACALLLLNQLWNLHVSNGRLKKIAMLLGSDVPFFLEKVPAIGTSRGEVLHPVNWEIPCFLVIVMPEIRITAEWAYMNNKVSLPRKEDVSLFSNIFTRSKSLVDLKKYVFNDLEAGVFEKYPELEAVKKELYTGGADYAALSGSGSSVFGMFTDKQAAEKTVEVFNGRYRTEICIPLNK